MQAYVKLSSLVGKGTDLDVNPRRVPFEVRVGGKCRALFSNYATAEHTAVLIERRPGRKVEVVYRPTGKVVCTVDGARVTVIE